MVTRLFFFNFNNMKKIFSIFLLGLLACLYTPKANAESTVYIIMNYDALLSGEPIIKLNVNDQHVCDMELTLKKQTQDFYQYKKAVKKLIFNEEDTYIISYDLNWYGDVPHHADITLDLVDGETYYIQLGQKSFKNAWAFKLLTEKEAMKKLKKAKDYDFLPDYVHPTE